MLRLAHVSFRREARWLMIAAFALPVIGLLMAVVFPAVGRWLGWR